jgi:hypothetical protein
VRKFFGNTPMAFHRWLEMIGRKVRTMGRRGPKQQSPETRRQISESLRSSSAFKDSMHKRAGQKHAPDSIEVRAHKAASKYAPPGTARNQFEYELAVQRISMLENQAKRRAWFIEQASAATTPEGV